MYSMVMLVFVTGMFLNGQPIANNSIVLLRNVGEGDAGALLCTTDRTACCGTAPNRFGQWYYPDRTVVPIDGAGQPYYRNRGDMLIRLNRRSNQGLSVMYSGVYCCEIPDQNNVNQTLCVGAYLTESAGECYTVCIMCAAHITIHCSPHCSRMLQAPLVTCILLRHTKMNGNYFYYYCLPAERPHYSACGPPSGGLKSWKPFYTFFSKLD